MFERSWVPILALYSGWTFFSLICCRKEADDGPFKKVPFTRHLQIYTNQTNSKNCFVLTRDFRDLVNGPFERVEVASVA